MKNNTKKALTGIGAIFAIIGLLYFSGLFTQGFGFFNPGGITTENDHSDNPKPTSNINYPAADFSLQLLSTGGETITLEAMRGKVIFINIWATWCPPCILEMPGINELFKATDKEKVAFVMLTVDAKFQKAIDFQKNKGYDFEIYKTVGSLPQMYSTSSIPTTFVINARGDLVLTHLGMGDFNTEEFKNFLKEQY